MDMETWVIQWFVKHANVSEEEIRNHMDVNYFNKEYIDSFEFIELIGDIEDLGIELDNEQFEDRKFATIRGLIEILNQKKG